MRIAFSLFKENIAAFRKANCFAFYHYDPDTHTAKLEKEEDVKACAYIVDKLFMLIDEKVDLVVTSSIEPGDKTALENSDISSRMTTCKNPDCYFNEMRETGDGFK